MNGVPIKSLYNHLLYQISLILSKCGIEYVAPMPSFLSIEPSAVCQLHCPQCPCGTNSGLTRKNAFMPLPLFKKILHDCHGWVHTFQFYFQGEPLLNPDLPAMIQLASKEHIYTTCSTNAQALSPLLAQQLIEAGLNRIIVSIDGLSENSYQSYRQGGSLNRALQGLIYLRQAKEQTGGHTHIELQCLRLKSNEHEWEMMQRSYRQMGADSLTLKTAQFYDYKQGTPLMPSEERYSRYQRMDDGTYLPKNRLHSLAHHSCRRILSGCVITVDGDVLPCCFDKDKHYVMGNIKNSDLASVWQAETFRLFRQQVRVDRMNFPMCHNCTE